MQTLIPRLITAVFVCFVVATFQINESHQAVEGSEFRFLNVDKVWKKGITGKGVTVAVVDDGLNFNHDDLRPNYKPDLSYDFLENDSRPNPSTGHGTKCAGVIAATKNGTCRTGIAYNAKIAGIKAISTSPSGNERETAKGFKYKRNEIDIYSCSWGPIDNGYVVRGPAPLVRKALKFGAKLGRNKKGSIFVFSSGNGGFVQDSCAFDGYVNNIRTIAIGAVSKSGTIPRYVESCSSVIASAVADGVRTCGLRQECVANFGKTSAAAAMASGIIALLLEANNELTWRDVQHLIVRTSSPRREITGKLGWIVNGAGLMVHPSLGFGIMEAYKLVEAAQTEWTGVPKQEFCDFKFKERRHFDRAKPSFTISMGEAKKKCSKIKYIEHVRVNVNLTFPMRGLLEMYLISPSGTISQLLYKRVYDALTRRNSYNNLVVTSLHFWGENPSAKDGIWKLLFKSVSFKNGAKGILSKFQIRFFGTERDPIPEKSTVQKGMVKCPYGNNMKLFSGTYGSDCCGNAGVYDQRVAKCCRASQEIVEKNPVCGTMAVYDKCTQICCYGRVNHKLDGDNVCCGSQVYNPTTHICCGNQLWKKIKCMQRRDWYRGRLYLSPFNHAHKARCYFGRTWYESTAYTC